MTPRFTTLATVADSATANVSGIELMPAFYCEDMRKRVEALTGVQVFVNRVALHDEDMFIHITIPATERIFRLECTVTRCHPIAGIEAHLTLRSLIEQEQFSDLIETIF